MTTPKMFPLNIRPGTQRDGTDFAKRRWIDTKWTRFQRGLPRKIGGYFQVDGTLPRIPRGMTVIPNSPNFNIYIGDSDSLKYLPINENGFPIAPLIDRTPALFQASPNNLWRFDSMFSSSDDSSILVAHAAPNLASIDSAIERPVYYGDILSNTPLVPTPFSTAGGFVVLHPYLVIFGNAGKVIVTAANDPTTELDNDRVAAQKIVYGLATRGGNSSPAGLLWSLDAVIRMTNVSDSNAPTFRFDTVTTESSILSSQSVVEYDSIYYWCGTDRFLYYNGTVNELPNDTNLNFFFDNLDFENREKVWATKVTQFGEIWWFFPKRINGQPQTECNHALIYNVREQLWYDTPIDRSCGFYEQTFAEPIWAGNTLNDDMNYSLWLQETGVDQIADNIVTPIPFHCETSNIAWCAQGPDNQYSGIDRWVYLYRLEIDAIQSGNMTLDVNGKDYARDDVKTSTFDFDGTTDKIDMREQRREMTLKFSGAEAGVDFQMGQMLMDVRIGDARQ